METVFDGCSQATLHIEDAIILNQVENIPENNLNIQAANFSGDIVLRQRSVGENFSLPLLSPVSVFKSSASSIACVIQAVK